MWKFSIVYAVIAKHGICLHWLILFYVLLTSVFFCLKIYMCSILLVCVLLTPTGVCIENLILDIHILSNALHELSLYSCVHLIYQENCIDVWNIKLYIAILCLEAQLNSTIYSSNLFGCIFLPGVKLRRPTFMPSLFRNVSYITNVCRILLHPDLRFYGNYMIFLYLLM